MSANELDLWRRVYGSSRSRLLAWLCELNAGERIALGAILVTPFALYVDYRVGATLVDDLVEYRPIGESGGRVVSYHQLFGWTQVVWLTAGAVTFAARTTRPAFRAVPVVLAVGLLTLILGVTVARGGIDRTTVIALGATLVPLIAMVAVLASPVVRQEVRRVVVTIFVVECAAVVLLSLAKKAMEGTSGRRLEAFAFGPAPEMGLVLAAVLLLAFATVGPVTLRAALVGVTGMGLLLTETRGATLAAVAGGVTIALLLPRVRLWVVGGVGTLVLVFVLTTSRSLSFSDLSTKYRRQNLAHHWDLFEQEPLWGYGVNASGIDAFRAAHAVSLEMANAAGIFAAILFALIWLVPVIGRLRRGNLDLVPAAAVAVVTAMFVGWITTGSAVLIYNPPTNLLPLVLAIGLLEPRAFSPRLM